MLNEARDAGFFHSDPFIMRRLLTGALSWTTTWFRADGPMSLDQLAEEALALVIKAKLEAVAAQISTVEEEFLAHICLPDGSTVGDWAAPQLAIAYERGSMPALMPGVSATSGSADD